MDVFEALYTTRAMRRVKEDPIPEEIIKTMVDAAIRAPSGSNRQGWKFLVVTDPNIRKQLGDVYRETWDYYMKEFYGGKPDLGASEVGDDEKANQVIRISKSAGWLAENFHKVPVHFVILSRNDPTGSSIFPATWSLMLAGRAHDIGTCLTTVMSFKQKEAFEILGVPDDKGWTCLLYTSPSPRDLSTSRMPSSA